MHGMLYLNLFDRRRDQRRKKGRGFWGTFRTARGYDMVLPSMYNLLLETWYILILQLYAHNHHVPRQIP